MKRLFAFLVVLMLLGAAAGAQVYYEASAGIGWDPAPMTDTEGTPYLSTDTVEYEVLLWDMAGGDPTVQPYSALLEVAVVSSPMIDPLPIPYRATWAVIVRVRHTDGGGNVAYSDGIYSVVAADTRDGTGFTLVPVTTWIPMPPPGGMYVIQ